MTLINGHRRFRPFPPPSGSSREGSTRCPAFFHELENFAEIDLFIPETSVLRLVFVLKTGNLKTVRNYKS